LAVIGAADAVVAGPGVNEVVVVIAVDAVVAAAFVARRRTPSRAGAFPPLPAGCGAPLPERI
jgi:hypothetical protein